MTTSWTARTLPSTSWEDTRINLYLLLEDGGFLLLEDGGKIILEQSGKITTSWTQRVTP